MLFIDKGTIHQRRPVKMGGGNQYGRRSTGVGGGWSWVGHKQDVHFCIGDTLQKRTSTFFYIT